MASFSFDPTPIVNWVPEIVRSWLPWQWRPSISNWIVWAAVFAGAAAVCAIMHVIFREKPKVDWFFLKTGSPLAIGWERKLPDSPLAFRVGGIQLNGVNVSGHPLSQVSGEIHLHRDKRVLPLYIIADGQWSNTSEIDPIAPLAILNLGASFRADGEHWAGFEKEISPEQFLQDFGGFDAVINLDGDEQKWTFSIDQLRQAIDEYKRNEAERQQSNPAFRAVRKRKAA